MAKIRFKIDKNGDATILTVCGEGVNCEAKTRNFEKAIGIAQESTRQATAEFFEHEEEERLLIAGVETDGET